MFGCPNLILSNKKKITHFIFVKAKNVLKFLQEMNCEYFHIYEDEKIYLVLFYSIHFLFIILV